MNMLEYDALNEIRHDVYHNVSNSTLTNVDADVRGDIEIDIAEKTRTNVDRVSGNIDVSIKEELFKMNSTKNSIENNVRSICWFKVRDSVESSVKRHILFNIRFDMHDFISDIVNRIYANAKGTDI